MANSNIIDLLEKGEYRKALILLDGIEVSKRSSDDYRLMGQGQLELGNVDDAINSLIEALRLDSENVYALLLIGNIYYSHKKDFDTCKKYFGRILELDDVNYLALNNIAGVYAKEGDYRSAKKFFNKSLEIKPYFINSLYGIALVAYHEKKYLDSFNSLTKIFDNLDRYSSHKDMLVIAKNLLNQVCLGYDQTVDHESLYLPFLKELEVRAEKRIRIEDDENISVAAKLIVAEYHNKHEHVIKLNSQGQSQAYFVLHELMHLHLILEARNANENFLFTSNDKSYGVFKTKLHQSKKWKALSQNIGRGTEELSRKLYDGMLSQMYNAPIDLFIERMIYNDFNEVRPLQLHGMILTSNDAVQSFNNEEVKQMFPKFIRDTNIILSSLQLYQMEELYGIDTIKEVKEKKLLRTGKAFYNEYNEIGDDKDAGEEYEVIRLWAEDLNIEGIFKLKKENLPTVNESLEDQIARIESDPFNLTGDTTEEDKLMAEFVESHKEDDLNMAVAFYMADALKYIEDLDIEDVKKIGYEIAMLGRTGINPNGSDEYKLSSVKGKSYTGWKLLSWMYVTWMHFDPDSVPTFKLNFDKEYRLAISLDNS